MTLEAILAKLSHVKKQRDGSFFALCPAHNDHQPSLHITEAGDRKLLLKCQAGCDTETICQALNITLADLFIESGGFAPLKEKQIVATYDYLDELGQLLFQVVRYEPKSFSQRHKDKQGEWAWNIKGVRQILYHLADILTATETIYFVEGEKDADLLWQWGQVATTSPGGANNWKLELATPLAGKRVVIIPDKDTAGYNYARAVANSLIGKAKELKCIILPGEKVKDVSDWLEQGGDVADLDKLEQDISALFLIEKPSYRLDAESITWVKDITGSELTFKAQAIQQERTGVHARLTIELANNPLAWSLLNIERSEDRVRLANQAATKISENRNYTKEDLRADLDLFCLGLWDFQL